MHTNRIRLALVLLVASIVPQGGIAAPVGSENATNDIAPDEQTGESRLPGDIKGKGVGQVGSNSLVVGSGPFASADILYHGDQLAYQPPVLGSTVLLRTGADLYFSSRERPRAKPDSAAGTGTGSAGLNSDLDRSDSRNHVGDVERRREVSILSSGEPVQQASHEETAQILRIGKQALDFYNGGSEILLSSTDIVVTAPMPRETWMFLPMLAGLVAFFHMSARKRI